jgi:hypothetical protein
MQPYCNGQINYLWTVDKVGRPRTKNLARGTDGVRLWEIKIIMLQISTHTYTTHSPDGHTQDQPHGSEETCISVFLVSASALIRWWGQHTLKSTRIDWKKKRDRLWRHCGFHAVYHHYYLLPSLHTSSLVSSSTTGRVASISKLLGEMMISPQEKYHALSPAFVCKNSPLSWVGMQPTKDLWRQAKRHHFSL